TFYVFFFQAEDGIRDDLVTGVQTCALPISPRSSFSAAIVSAKAIEIPIRRLPNRPANQQAPRCDDNPRRGAGRLTPQRSCQWERSEERRVGKEGGWRVRECHSRNVNDKWRE